MLAVFHDVDGAAGFVIDFQPANGWLGGPVEGDHLGRHDYFKIGVVKHGSRDARLGLVRDKHRFKKVQVAAVDAGEGDVVFAGRFKHLTDAGQRLDGDLAHQLRLN